MQDEDAVAFLALSKLTLAYPGERGFERRADMRAIVNLTQRGIDMNNYHAGLKHFIVHASDAPELADNVCTLQLHVYFHLNSPEVALMLVVLGILDHNYR